MRFEINENIYNAKGSFLATARCDTFISSRLAKTSWMRRDDCVECIYGCIDGTDSRTMPRQDGNNFKRDGDLLFV
jgi:hypothetical protein